ncbi:MAG: DUF4065 domain-containing protein, partial [Cytophagales bacterium]|nr:DUF4065 domain-containing protein [Cytophagales bacterium]
TVSFRKETFEVVYRYYRDEENDLELTTTKLDELNLGQAYDQYREKHRLPFPEEIIAIREQYGLSATKMAEVLGFGVNVYRNYEHGEVPNESNARLIQLAKDPEDFRELLEKTDALKDKEWEKVTKKTEELILKKYRNTGQNYTKTLGLAAEPTVKTKLNKLLFYADFLHYCQTGRSISGLTYIAIQHGPVPKRFGTLFEMAEFHGLVTVERRETADGHEMNIFHPASEVTFDKYLFNDTENKSLETVAKKLGNQTMNKLVELSHQEKAWLQNVDSNSAIDYAFGFELSNV